MKTMLLIIGLAAILSGCASTPSGPAYRDYLAKIGSVKQDSARLFVYRSNGAVYSIPASVKIDGKSVGACENKGFNTFDLVPGRHVLVVDTPDTIGKCIIKLDVTAGNNYYYKINERLNFIRRMFYQSASPLILVGVLGDSLESMVRDCSGPYYVERVDSIDAQGVLSKLHLSEHAQ